MKGCALFLLLVCEGSPIAEAKGSITHHIRRECARCEARQAFKGTHPCPSSGKTSGACPGYVIHYLVPLKRGGADAPSNMQWQMTAGAKAKDKTEVAVGRRLS